MYIGGTDKHSQLNSRRIYKVKYELRKVHLLQQDVLGARAAVRKNQKLERKKQTVGTCTIIIWTKGV